MGVYVKDMKKPRSCDFCLISLPHAEELGCGFDLDHCPITEVPPHGRLGDLDKLEKMFADIDSAPYSCFDGAEPFYSAEDAAHIIRLAPTIIPASEDGEQ